MKQNWLKITLILNALLCFFWSEHDLDQKQGGGANFAPPPNEKRSKKCLMKLGLKAYRRSREVTTVYQCVVGGRGNRWMWACMGKEGVKIGLVNFVK